MFLPRESAGNPVTSASDMTTMTSDQCWTPQKEEDKHSNIWNSPAKVQIIPQPRPEYSPTKMQIIHQPRCMYIYIICELFIPTHCTYGLWWPAWCTGPWVTQWSCPINGDIISKIPIPDGHEGPAGASLLLLLADFLRCESSCSCWTIHIQYIYILYVIFMRYSQNKRRA